MNISFFRNVFVALIKSIVLLCWLSVVAFAIFQMFKTNGAEGTIQLVVLNIVVMPLVIFGVFRIFDFYSN